MQAHSQFRFEKPLPKPIESANVDRFDRDVDVKNRLFANDKETHFQQGQRIKVNEVVSGAGTTHFVQQNQYVVGIKDLAVTRNVQLPPAKKSGVGKTFIIKDLIGGAGTTTITIASKEGETVDGAASTTISANYGTTRLLCDGSNWFTW